MSQIPNCSEDTDFHTLNPGFNPREVENIFVKNNAVIAGLMPVMLEELLPRLSWFWDHQTRHTPEIGRLVITSGREGTHSKNSRHYLGLAVDLRTRHMSKKAIYRVCSDLQEYLNDRWRVVIRSNCLHIQFQGSVVPTIEGTVYG
jgi:hypothetical protein